MWLLLMWLFSDALVYDVAIDDDVVVAVFAIAVTAAVIYVCCGC